MASTNCTINISLNNQIFSIVYTINQNKTFQDLLEYFAYLYPSLKICQCYDFEIMLNNYNYYCIEKKSKLVEYSNYLNNLQLYNNKGNCEHDDNHNPLLFSKKDIFDTLSQQILNNKKDKEINQLNEKIKLLQETIKNNNGTNEILNNKNKEIFELKNKIEKLIKENNEMNNKVKDYKTLQNENMILTQTINGNTGMIMQLNKTGLINNKKFLPEQYIGINEKNGQVIIENSNIKQKPDEKFYDIIVHIDSIKDINKGWRVEMSPNAEKNYKNFKTQQVLRIGVIGNANKGKSFILSKISKMKLPSGMSIKTEGLSIKYPDLTGGFNNRKIALLDSAGLETPVLVDDIKDNEKNEIFKEKSREKLITELFLQNYIVNNSDILIVVVDSLSFSEQKLLLKVKKEMERAKRKIPLYIIHNLKTFITIKQVEDYIQNTLLKSATFKLEKSHNINTKYNHISDIHCYNEITQDKDQKIVHFIYANEGSPAGEKYNNFGLDYIEKAYQGIFGLQPFDVIESIKERYIKVSKDITEKTEKENLSNDSFQSDDPYLIKLKDEKEIILKKCLIDELGFSNFKANGFEPKYNIFCKDNKIIVRVEAPGNCDLESKIEIQGEYNVIKLYGEKRKDKEPENLDKNIFTSREIGPFSLEIPLKFSEYHLKAQAPKMDCKKGVYMVEYELVSYEEKKEEKQFFQDGEI